MSYQNISYSMSQADYDEIIAAVATINSKMPFLITLDKKDVKSIFKLGSGSVDFAQDSLFAASTFPQILPASFDADEYAKDATLFKQLSDIKIVLDSLVEKVSNTYMAVGGESMTACLEVYAYVQTAKDRVPGLKSVADKLNTRFKRQSRKKKKEGIELPQPEN